MRTASNRIPPSTQRSDGGLPESDFPVRTRSLRCRHCAADSIEEVSLPRFTERRFPLRLEPIEAVPRLGLNRRRRDEEEFFDRRIAIGLAHARIAVADVVLGMRL